MNLFEIYKYSFQVLSNYYDSRESEALTFRLMSFHFHHSKTDIVTSGKNIVPHDKKTTDYWLKLERLKKYEPLEYITGSAFFNDFELRVNHHVLIPRPETEEVVRFASQLDLSKKPHILDIGTGSGCISLSLKKAFPCSEVSACDISENAISVAKENACKYNLEINFFLLDILKQDQWQDIRNDLNLVISNPPYVKNIEKKQMKKNVLGYEPPVALFVPDDDPLLFFRNIIEFSMLKLQKGGFIVLEINESLAMQTVALLNTAHFDSIRIHKDINEKNRYVSARKTT